MNERTRKNIMDAVERAMKYCRDGDAVWNPVFVDLNRCGQKIAHIASNGFTHTTWNFYPIPRFRSQQSDRYGEAIVSGHRDIKNKSLVEIIPGWAKGNGTSFGNAMTYHEKFPQG